MDGAPRILYTKPHNPAFAPLKVQSEGSSRHDFGKVGRHIMNHSIRRRLLVALSGAITAAWSLTVVFSYVDIRYEVTELLDAQLAQSARALLAFNTTSLGASPSEAGSSEKSEQLPVAAERLFAHRYENKLAFQIWRSSEELALRSPNSPMFPISSKEYGYSDVDVMGHSWRVFSLPDDNSPMIVKVGEQYEIREALIQNIAVRTLLPLAFALPFLGMLTWFGVGRALKPLEKLARQVQNRAPSFLEPVDDSGVPAEAKPLVDSLNNLFTRLDLAFEGERRFTADAAHELRTPLAGIKAQAQVALKSGNPQNREKALHRVVEGVDRATHLVHQLLTLARLDPDNSMFQVQKVNLRDVAHRVAGDLDAMAADKRIKVTVDIKDDGVIMGHPDALGILLRNLVDNAIRYTPDGGRIDISVRRHEGNLILSVADSGPGIPPEDREQVFKRFYRRLGTKAAGSGLGLSIVSRIIELHQANITLDTSIYQGLQIDVIFRADKTQEI